MQKGFAQILIVGVVFSVIVLGVTLYLKQIRIPSNVSSQISNNNQIGLKNTPSDQSGKIATWKTYANTFGTFELKYPYDWTVDEQDKTSMFNGVPTIQAIFSKNLSIEIQQNNNFENNESYLDFYRKNPRTGTDISGKDNRGQIFVDNIKVFFQTNHTTPALIGGEGNKPFWYSEASFLKNGKTYTFLFSSDEKEGNNQELFKLILSTFQFKN